MSSQYYDSMDKIIWLIGQAINWHKKAIREGLEEAQLNLEKCQDLTLDQQFILGYSYKEGNGVNQFPLKALEWFLKAAAQGHVTSQYQVSKMYRDGEGVTQDNAESAKWMLKAAEQGNELAQYEMGLFYSDGVGVQKDNFEAVKWMKKAEKQGSALASLFLMVDRTLFTD